MMTYTVERPPSPTNLVSLVCLDSAEDVAHFRDVQEARSWALRQHGKQWAEELMVWDNVSDRVVS